MQPVEQLCRVHLLGCHSECHKLVGSLNKHRSITGYIQHNCVELVSLQSYHDELVEEMIRRDYNHKSPLPDFEVEHVPFYELIYTIDQQKSEQLLRQRCDKCFNRKL